MPQTRYALSRPLRDPVIVMAFGGWSDAAQAATDAIEHLATTYEAEQVLVLDPSDYYDFQSTRPMAGFDTDGNRTITWPTTEALVAPMPGRDLVLIRGPEPNFRWPAYASELTQIVQGSAPGLVVILGALLSENPHSRPVPVAASSMDEGLRETYGAEKPTYEGPTGMTGIMAQACQVIGFPTLSVWASAPHYVSNQPNPKATLALITALEDYLGEPIDLGDLPARAEMWERTVDEVAEDDPEVTEYIQGLEAADDARRPQPSGDAIAAEFQRYLRRRPERDH